MDEERARTAAFDTASWGRLGGLGGLLGTSWTRLSGRNRIPSPSNNDLKIDQNFDAYRDQGRVCQPVWEETCVVKTRGGGLCRERKRKRGRREGEVLLSKSEAKIQPK